MNIGGPYLGQLDASLLGSPAPSWCRARALATRSGPQGRAQVVRFGASRATGHNRQDPSRTTARRAAINGTYGPLATQLRPIRPEGRPYVYASAAQPVIARFCRDDGRPALPMSGRRWHAETEMGVLRGEQCPYRGAEQTLQAFRTPPARRRSDGRSFVTHAAGSRAIASAVPSVPARHRVAGGHLDGETRTLPESYGQMNEGGSESL